MSSKDDDKKNASNSRGTMKLTVSRQGAVKDLPPFTVARHGANTLCGLNSVGLRRAGFTTDERLELKRLYRALFAANVNLREALAKARGSFNGAAAKTLLEFVAESKRGVCTAKGGDEGDAQAAAAGERP